MIGLKGWIMGRIETVDCISIQVSLSSPVSDTLAWDHYRQLVFE